MSAEVLQRFEEPIRAPDGTRYLCLICGRPLENGVWEAWIEFVPEGGGPLLRSRRETSQSNRRNLEGWASRLSPVYLEGSLVRTLDLEKPRIRPRPRTPASPHFQGPAPGPGAAAMAPDDAALSPFLYFRISEHTLRTKLWELSAVELRIMIGAYGFETSGDDPGRLSRRDLIELIVRAVRERMQGGR